MTKKTASRSTKTPATDKKARLPGPFQLLKGIVLVVVAISALVAGIFKGGEGIFFGAIFAIGFGFLGVLSLLRGEERTKTSAR
jgi:hypothetical protein